MTSRPPTGTPGPADGSTAPIGPTLRTTLVRTGLIVGILVLVFGVILPRFVDYEDVIATFRSLTLGQLAVMMVAVAVAWLVSGAMFPILMGHLSLLRGTESYLILSGIGASVPMGPWNMGVLWVVLRGWGVPNKPATSGMALYGVINQLNRLLTPADRARRGIARGHRRPGLRRGAVHRVAERRDLRRRDGGPHRRRPFGPDRGLGGIDG